jgi:hypothetical protein
MGLQGTGAALRAQRSCRGQVVVEGAAPGQDQKRLYAAAACSASVLLHRAPDTPTFKP